MKSRYRLLFAFVILVLPSMAVQADDLTGAEQVLCTSIQATVCSADGECEIGMPWTWGIPQFIEIDFKDKMLRTTKASHARRETPFRTHERANGLIFIQGVETGRAFSFVIEETSGILSAAIAREEVTVSVFGACTPLPNNR